MLVDQVSRSFYHDRKELYCKKCKGSDSDDHEHDDATSIEADGILVTIHMQLDDICIDQNNEFAEQHKKEQICRSNYLKSYLRDNESNIKTRSIYIRTQN